VKSIIFSPRFQDYLYAKFSSRLSSLQMTMKDANDHADQDQQAFDNFKANHTPLHFTHKGYIQWQKSEAQERLLEDIKAGFLESKGKKELYESRPEYYENFPLDTFRDKIAQEVQTAMYLHTLRVKGKSHKAS
jgi:hypothetical protein